MLLMKSSGVFENSLLQIKVTLINVQSGQYLNGKAKNSYYAVHGFVLPPNSTTP